MESHVAQKAPSGWVLSNRELVQKIANELGKRFAYKTNCIFGPQVDFQQPLRLHNTEPMPTKWDEERFWDELSEHYRDRFSNS